LILRFPVDISKKIGPEGIGGLSEVICAAKLLQVERGVSSLRDASNMPGTIAYSFSNRHDKPEKSVCSPTRGGCVDRSTVSE
jgi:hypothetical protein